MSVQGATRLFNVQNIAIIGAGPSGLAAAKFFLAEKAFRRIDIFEQRNNVGGIWNYTPEDRSDSTFSVPQANPHAGLEKPIWHDGVKSSGSSDTSDGSEQSSPGTSLAEHGEKTAVFISPLYERLETNIPRPLMRYSDHLFPDDSQLFPKHQTVQEYLEAYATDVWPLIKFQTQVVDVWLLQSRLTQEGVEEEQWNVKTRDLVTGKEREDNYDAVVAASGHFSVPYIPDIKGIGEWDRAYPGVISHSKFYRLPEEFADKKVIVVGNSASGLDIGGQLLAVCRKPLLMSVKSESYLSAGFSASPDKEELPPIEEFILSDRSVRFANGRVEKQIDAIVFCTGYLYSFPFLESLHPNPITNGTRVEHTYQHLFYAPHPTLSFLTLPQKIIPFPLAEAQSAVLARVYSGRLALPSYHEMQDWERQVIQERGDQGEFHTLQFPRDAEYINMLYDWAASAPPRERLADNGRGKMPRRWGAWEHWARERFPAIRRAFVEKGEGRAKVWSLEAVGFDFEKWKEERKKEDRSSL